jgi:hypothetical protein
MDISEGGASEGRRDPAGFRAIHVSFVKAQEIGQRLA